MAKRLMIQGTMSGAGKSLLVTALCRIFAEDGFSVAPFKSQNMALNSYVTKDGLEMGRAQVAQSEAARKEPDVRMNPVLLKPSSDTGSQVIVNGIVRGQMTAVEYFAHKKQLIPDILNAFESLSNENDIIVIEGAGSPAEINLRENDIVNMGLAELVNAPVLLAGDIDRGGVFAQLYGTCALLSDTERARVKGLVINKFRGDETILRPGLDRLKAMTGIPVIGVVPYLHVDIDDEDSLSERLGRTKTDAAIDIAVIRLPHISNFTDFAPLEALDLCGVRYVDRADRLGTPDLIILPGTKNTTGDLCAIRESGLEQAVIRLANAGIPVIGICGGYQMLGDLITDEAGIEGSQKEIRGMGLLPVRTAFEPEKTLTRVKGHICNGPLKGAAVEGYEIHMGETAVSGDAFCLLENGNADGCVNGNVFGTYLHGLFDTADAAEKMADWLCGMKGIDRKTHVTESRAAYRDRQYAMLAEAVRRSLDMKYLYHLLDQFIDE